MYLDHSLLDSNGFWKDHEKVRNSRGYISLVDSLEASGLVLLESQLSEICFLLYASYNLGINEEFIQASGGNTSLKISHYILVKASGTKLSNCLDENIFILLDLETFNSSDLKFTPSKDVCGSELRPSIEAAFHSLIDKKFVIHTHPIDLIRASLNDAELQARSNNIKGYHPILINYFKPGNKLAFAIKECLQNHRDVYYVLKNHGLLYGCEFGQDILDIHASIIENFSLKTQKLPNLNCSEPSDLDLAPLRKLGLDPYLSLVPEVNALAFNDSILNCFSKNAIFPDAVVFLGKYNVFLSNYPADWSPYSETLKLAKFLLIKDVGVVILNCTSESSIKTVELFLKIHFLIYSGLANYDKINNLTDEQVNELLNWDAEKYRQSMLK